MDKSCINVHEGLGPKDNRNHVPKKHWTCGKCPCISNISNNNGILLSEMDLALSKRFWSQILHIQNQPEDFYMEDPLH